MRTVQQSRRNLRTARDKSEKPVLLELGKCAVQDGHSRLIYGMQLRNYDLVLDKKLKQHVGGTFPNFVKHDET